ncbi:MAG: RagB/SusD family nutrient uptake outer membrane protein [Prevotella sp.]|nr:RagB/SusD family nutrient uptake outer membrane protein [Prevotella sp.]MDD7074652.1 RagB/SusD family nutrient uptake outer membrane protein [Prevotellaceae bacterium]MDY5343420.1 RagB/SusD family nutrient uptake outer membrane protein [Prevotella sp.]
MKKYIFIAMATMMGLTSCDDLFSPANDNFKDLSMIETDNNFGQSFLMDGYSAIPGYYNNTDWATDDAVTNDKTNNMMKMATGSWTSNYNPVDCWGRSLAAIQYLNIYIANGEKVNYVKDPAANELFRMRTMGEAHGLRALHYYYLLRAHGGVSGGGEYLGVPLLLEFQDAAADFNQPRATFADIYKQIESDLKKAEELLPDVYGDLNSDDDVPEKYRGISTQYGVYNRAFGDQHRLLFSGLIAKSFRSRLTLLAASPLFADANAATWKDAADAAASVLDVLGGIDGLDPNGVTYYDNDSEINSFASGSVTKEIIWRENVGSANTSLEEENYPPSLFGKGRTNPTQNLVDAFPMASGYPISESDEYDSNSPFDNRDPRLLTYILCNGQPAGPSGTAIYTGSDAGKDGLNYIETSTRTGYYLKKRLRQSVNCDPTSKNSKIHFNPRIRSTEIFLNYAEAANEAFGPTNDGGHGYSAYDVIKAIRKRAGLGVNGEDPYLESIKDNKDKMRELIRNERRLELCFEGFRFWDLRRWKANLNETAKGVDINNLVVNYIEVEHRNYKDYMYYGPIPYSETLKYSNLEQNKGW